MLSDQYQHYREQVNSAVLRFQFLEELMRINIAEFNEVIKESVSDRFPYKPENKSYTPSYGQLVTELGRYNPNQELQQKLTGLKGDRNFIAHQAFLIEVSKIEPEGWKELIAKATDIAVRADSCVRQLVELGKVI